MLVRNLHPGEPLPAELKTGFERLKLDHEWVWVVEHEGRVCAALITAAAHSLVMLLRVSTHQAPPMALLSLLRKARRDACNRGYTAWIFYLGGVDNQRLNQIAKSMGGSEVCDSFRVWWGLTRRTSRLEQSLLELAEVS